MSERILRAFMQLFAIGASLERLTQQSRSVVEAFLMQQISLQRVREYLAIFDEHVKALQGVDDPTKARKKIALSSVKALRICTEINQELNIRQKYIVFIRLAEFMNSSDEAMTKPEKEFLETVSNVFNIDASDHALCLALSDRVPDPRKLESKNVLLCDAGKTTGGLHGRHLFHADLDGSLWFVYIKNANIFFLRYAGQDTLTLNGQPVDPRNVSVFTQGAVLRGQKIQPLYYSDILHGFLEVKQEHAFRMDVRDLEYTFPGGKKGLQSINFSASSGQLVSIMGGSGAGKSTLLGVLNGSSNPSAGKILVNGIDLYGEPGRTEGLIGNIPQDDLLIEELTVFQNLFYNTKLVYGELTDEEITKKVDGVLDVLGLSQTRELIVGNVLNKTISGGQRKRLNIALELVREPSILFVDEPTSGLSSRDAENVMDLLKQLSLTGKLVFVVIHQPSSDVFRMFDKLLVLDTGGYPVYFGNPSDSLIYFKKKIHFADADESECPVCGNINPEQIFNIIELHEVDEFGNLTRNRKITPPEWYQWFAESQAMNTPPATAGDLPAAHAKKAGPFRQWKIYFMRDLLAKLGNRQYLLINLLEAPVLAGILGFILRYSKPDSGYAFIDNPNVPAYLFICVIVALFFGLSVSAEEIIRDRKIRQRESFLHLNRNSYLFSKIALLFLLSAIQTITFVLVGNAWMGIHSMTMIYWLVLFTTSCFANMLGLNISSGLDSVVTIYILIPFLIIPQILLSGVIVKFEKLNPAITKQADVPLIGNVMASRWAFEALSVSQFRDNPYECNFYDLDAGLSRATFKKDWWLPLLRERVDKADHLIRVSAPADSIRPVLNLVINELKQEAQTNTAVKINCLSALSAPEISANLPAIVRKDLDSLQEYYINTFNSVNDKKEALMDRFTVQEERRKEFAKLKRDHYNESLDQLVRNSNQTERVAVVNDRIIERMDPVFQAASGSNLAGGTFYSPEKNVFGRAVDTYVANMLVIWGMTILLYFTLVSDLLRKLINLSGKKNKS